MARIFITGASGFVGGAVAAHFVAKGDEVKAMSRTPASDGAISALGAEPVRASLGGVEAADLAGCDTVIHCAAYVEAWGPLSAYWRANVEGTVQLLDAAKAAGVKHFVHIGTEAALFFGQHMRDVDETYPLALNSPFPYSRTKAHAEARVRAANDPGHGFATVVVRPRLVWGPGDKTVLPEVIAMEKSGRFMWVDGGKAMTSTTHIANLVRGVELALAKGVGGEAYFVTDGAPVQFRDFMTRLAGTVGVELADKSVSGALLRGAARIIEPVWRLFRIKPAPPITRFVASIMSRDCTIRDDKARRDLGYVPVISVDEGLSALAAASR